MAAAVPPGIAAVLADEAIGWDALVPALAEASGGIVLREAALDRALERQMTREGLALDAGQLERERTRLLEDFGGDRAAMDRTLARLGIGPTRSAALLRRRAMLRALTAGSRVVGEREIALAHELSRGERRRVRVLAFADERTASAARAEVAGRPDAQGRREAFAALAAERALNGIESRGGAWWSAGAVSARDPGLPEAFRRAVFATDVGAVTPVFALPAGAGVALVEAVVPGSDEELTPERREDVATELADRVQERAMQDLAERLVREAGVSVIDPSLGWSWRNAR